MPKVENYGNEKEWMAACVPARVGEGNEQDQAVAACMNMWKERDGGGGDGKSVDPDTLIAFGGEVKALGENHVGGYLVLFGDSSSADIEGDFFTKETDFGLIEGQPTPVYLNHCMPLRTREGKAVGTKAPIGRGTLTLDDTGVLIDAILYNRELYLRALEKMGWSSGTAPHLVERETEGKARRITRWPLGLDASLTPIPADPRNAAVPLKSWMAAHDAAGLDFPEQAETGGGDGGPSRLDAVELERLRAENDNALALLNLTMEV